MKNKKRPNVKQEKPFEKKGNSTVTMNGDSNMTKPVRGLNK